MTLLKRLFGGQNRGDEPHVRLLLETMLIMIAADGQVDDAEMRRFMAQVRTHDELSHISQRIIDKHLQEAFVAIRREGLERRVQALARGLRRPEHRLAAVGMALAIATGDGELSDEEYAVLNMLQENFELSDAQIQSAIEAARSGNMDSLVEEGRDFNLERLYIETMLLMAAADGVIDPAELDRFSQELAHQRTFDQLTPEQLGSFMETCLEALERDGLDQRLEALGQGLVEEAHKRTAFSLALEICLADGTADPHERTLLKMLQERLGLDDDHVSGEIQRILRGRR